MSFEEIDKDPLLPECFKMHANAPREAKQWVVDSIRKLNPSWWPRLVQGYNAVFTITGVYIPHREYNQRCRAANLWLLDKVNRFS